MSRHHYSQPSKLSLGSLDTGTAPYVAFAQSHCRQPLSSLLSSSWYHSIGYHITTRTMAGTIPRNSLYRGPPVVLTSHGQQAKEYRIRVYRTSCSTRRVKQKLGNGVNIMRADLTWRARTLPKLCGPGRGGSSLEWQIQVLSLMMST